MQLSEIKKIFQLELASLYQKEEIDSFFYEMLQFHLHLDKFVLVMQPNYTISKEEEQPFFKGLSELKREKPLQYILGEAHFMGSTLKVNNHVLIPRPETEELVQWVLDECKVESIDKFSSGLSRNPRILDIGTGSGCIAISLAKNLLGTKMHALDVSKEALAVARENAELNGVDIEFICADILNLDLNLEFDIIVSNPPYVRQLEKEEIHNNVKKHEPSQALFVPDHDPLIFYKAIAEFSKRRLIGNGALFLEINQYLGQETKLLFQEKNFRDVSLKKDIFGNDRMLRCIK